MFTSDILGVVLWTAISTQYSTCTLTGRIFTLLLMLQVEYCHSILFGSGRIHNHDLQLVKLKSSFIHITTPFSVVELYRIPQTTSTDMFRCGKHRTRLHLPASDFRFRFITGFELTFHFSFITHNIDHVDTYYCMSRRNCGM